MIPGFAVPTTETIMGKVRIMVHNGREKLVRRRLADVLIRRGKAIEVKPEPVKAKKADKIEKDEKPKRTYRRRDLQAEE